MMVETKEKVERSCLIRQSEKGLSSSKELRLQTMLEKGGNPFEKNERRKRGGRAKEGEE